MFIGVGLANILVCKTNMTHKNLGCRSVAGADPGRRRAGDDVAVCRRVIGGSYLVVAEEVERRWCRNSA